MISTVQQKDHEGAFIFYTSKILIFYYDTCSDERHTIIHLVRMHKKEKEVEQKGALAYKGEGIDTSKNVRKIRVTFFHLFSNFFIRFEMVIEKVLDGSFNFIYLQIIWDGRLGISE